MTSIRPSPNSWKPEKGVHTKTKQTRNKPTLSCQECVDRKTKCDRNRPCWACLKRRSSCEYTSTANLKTSAARSTANSGRPKSSLMKRKVSTEVRRTKSGLSSRSIVVSDLPSHNQSGPVNVSSGADASSFYTNGIYAKSAPSNVFGVGSQHPFSNYWTCQGGLPEVISVLPSKEQADILIAKYFDTVDPVVPFLHRRSFYAEYERFWELAPEQKNEADASLMALHYVMYAIGTQFMSFPSFEERSQTAEFYCSAANQALRVYSYLNRTSMQAIQAMLLMTYFLMNDNHASDAYAWAGIHLRQAYAMRLHRDPDVVIPNAPVFEKQARRKLWQAVFFQDTFFTILLKLPPTATHSDVAVESLSDENEVDMDGFDACLQMHSRVENLMSINVIAPQEIVPLPPPKPHHLLDLTIVQSDVCYLRCTWHLGNLVQDNLSSPCSLALPLCNSENHRTMLVDSFESLYRTFPVHLTTADHAYLKQQAEFQPRAVKQNLFLMSNYHHCLMLIYGTGNPEGNVAPDLKRALHSAHEALMTFFNLWTLFENEAIVWWVFQHRAFEESLLVAQFLANTPAGKAAYIDSDSIWQLAKDDVFRMLNIMDRYGSQLEIHATRKRVLYEAFQRIMI